MKKEKSWIGGYDILKFENNNGNILMEIWAVKIRNKTEQACTNGHDEITERGRYLKPYYKTVLSSTSIVFIFILELRVSIER